MILYLSSSGFGEKGRSFKKIWNKLSLRNLDNNTPKLKKNQKYEL